MALASYLQNSFLGGEWGPYAQGRMDDERYRSGMNVCRNVIPVEEGSATRRPGTRWCETTRKGKPARIRPFAFERAQPYMLEFTEQRLRMFSGASLVLEDVLGLVTGISATTPAEVTISAAHGLDNGDAVRFVNASSEGSLSSVSRVLNRTFEITSTGPNTFTIIDPASSQPIDGSIVDMEGVTMSVGKVLELETPYVGRDSEGIDTLQDEDECLILHGAYRPRIITDVTEEGDEYKSFTFTEAEFIDGPYLDPYTESTLTPSGNAGVITLVEAGAEYEFVASDVGRLIRLFSQPALWNIATSYSVGQSVTFGESYYVATTDNSAKQPDTSLTDWALDPTVAEWTWGKITAVTNGSTISLEVKGDPLVSLTPVREWRLGLYSNTTGWPYTGCMHEGRVWLAGAVPNRIDGSKANAGLLDFTPTGPDGTVADDNACAFTLRAQSQNPVMWLVTDDQGIIIGTQSGEWLLRASQLNDPITPTSVQAKQMTNYGCSDARPTRAGGSTLFVQRHNRRLLEYTAFAEARFLGANLTAHAQHLTAPGLVEISYQQERTPLVWGHCLDGSLIGCTYRRDNPGGTQAAQYAGWHRHDLGGERSINSIASGPSVGGLTDSTMMVTYNNAGTPVYWVELLTDIFDQDQTVEYAWFLDEAITPVAADQVGNTVTFYGLNHLEGTTVSVWACGVDVGDYPVINGAVETTLGTPALWTQALLDQMRNSGDVFPNISVLIKNVGEAGLVDGSGIRRMTRAGGEVTGTNFGFGAASWGTNRFVSRASGSDIGYRTFNLETGAMIIDRVQDGGFAANEPFAFGYDGKLYTHDNNVGAVVQIDPDSLEITASVARSDLHNDVLPMGVSGGVMSTHGSHADWTAGTSLTVSDVSTGDQTILATPEWSRFGVTERHTGGGMGRGPYNSDVSTAYLITSRTGGLIARTCVVGQIHIVSLTSTGTASIQTLANILPADVDPTWTHFRNFTGALLDESDNNLVLAAECSAPDAFDPGDTYFQKDAVLGSDNHVYWCTATSTMDDPTVDPTDWQDLGPATYTANRYLFKVSTQTGAVLWATALDAWADDFSEIPLSHDLYNSRCRFGKYCWFVDGASSAAMVVFDLADGSTTDTVALVTGVSVGENQGFDDVSGALFGKMGYSPSGAPTDPLPDSPDTPAEGFGDWGLITGVEGELEDPYAIPAVIGYTYTSQGQILRPIAPQETGAQTGPALGKTRRTHQFSALLHKTQGISVGTSYDRLRPVQFRTLGGTAYQLNQLYSGIVQDTLEDDYSYDSMIAWQITRPYPATVLTLGAFIKTQDR